MGPDLPNFFIPFYQISFHLQFYYIYVNIDLSCKYVNRDKLALALSKKVQKIEFEILFLQNIEKPRALHLKS